MSPAARVLAAVLPILALALWSAPARSADPHEVYESRCTRCHEPHAGGFARENIALKDGVPVARRVGQPLARFLRHHPGGLAAEEVAALTDMFSRQLADGGLYAARCRACHDSARDLARLRLVLRDGRLIGRYSGRDMADFLQGHGRSDAEEAARLHDLLAWQLETAR